ncbi:23S rRNA (pseudouridine(1915)-N(3))-methyltransferase RlmH [Prochlorococcus sp. MIT 1300]|uniref:23S rRNA (pseudouridine(1915)-N(3))-methyltransferase RlmH n=1 Tax=Prochlorococcus sp. MIT 1300 TaxID=3096218 RepID=UPI002A74FD41|nr:23S rRNA (pseudouridine(1915)-N(3))-methyltransferase RlmH [Prochlorococcus sp. MIT 1300]
MPITSRYRIIAIGKVRKVWIQKGISLYLKRIPGLAITEIRDSSPQKESRAIKSALKHDELMVVLTEEGESLSSLAFSQRLQNLGSKKLAFVIGGAEGLTPELKSIANWKVSLSPMTFPHEIARLLLIEQLYRAHAILQGTPYHR